jgi:hypothetical protein
MDSPHVNRVVAGQPYQCGFRGAQLLPWRCVSASHASRRLLQGIQAAVIEHNLTVRAVDARPKWRSEGREVTSTTWDMVLLWAVAVVVIGFQVHGIVRDLRGRS